MGESDTDKPIREVDDEDREPEHGDRSETDDDEAGDIDATFVGDVYAGEDATVRVTANGSSVVNATVTYDCTADGNGEIIFIVPDGPEEGEGAYDGREMELREPVASDGDNEQETSTPTPDGGY